MADPTGTPAAPHPSPAPPAAGFRQIALLTLLLAAAVWSLLSAQWALGALILVFGALAGSLMWPGGQRIDAWIFAYINQHGKRPVLMDRAMWLATQLGNRVTAVLATILFLVVGRSDLAAGVIVGTFTLWILVELVKLLTNRTRPYLTLEDARVLGKRETGRSFPSGHTAQVFFMASLFSQQPGLGAGAIVALYGAALLVAVTRMYVGVHYPRDVVGGMLLGTIWGFVAALAAVYWPMLRF